VNLLWPTELPTKLGKENCHLTNGDEMTPLYLSARKTGTAGL